MLVGPGGVTAGGVNDAENLCWSGRSSTGKPEAQLLNGSRTSRAGSIEVIPPSPFLVLMPSTPFKNFWLMSMPSSYSVVVPLARPAVQGPPLRPLPVVLIGGAKTRS